MIALLSFRRLLFLMVRRWTREGRLTRRTAIVGGGGGTRLRLQAHGIHGHHAIDVFLTGLGLRIGEGPVRRHPGVNVGEVEQVLVARIHRLLDRARVEDRQATHHLGDVPVGLRVVDRPRGAAIDPLVAPADRRVHEARERPLGGLLIIGRQIEVVVLDARVLPERLGCGERDAHET